MDRVKRKIKFLVNKAVVASVLFLWFTLSLPVLDEGTLPF
ncbi:hypothetical protein SAMN06296036_104225 [Pseudobacteriovorax antillogorgiicola]|uniref:Uncharacterized protein n=1 Tax=Pseudobacteriovorax antillogorgiicola TaxID=1513793 RepID=A0A1Y6BLW5_9BACT|nr:hypothetical protein EDD56_104108 [Pseudobacteriovorax antillogorgiicola]SMF07592.1 hypothetical protein SAMN06296036_104225 [Pseudobacteriovorax antillogorgiicola]